MQMKLKKILKNKLIIYHLKFVFVNAETAQFEILDIGSSGRTDWAIKENVPYVHNIGFIKYKTFES